MGPRHYEAFVKDLKSRTKKFTPFWSSTKGLLDFLKKNIKKPTPFASVEEAKKQCKNPKDERLGKYEPAIRSLVKVWGTNRPYKAEPLVVVAAPAVARGLGGDVTIAKKVCKSFMDVKIADVDFSPNVRAAAKRKRIGGKSLYDIVKKNWDPKVHGPLTLSNKHEAALNNTKRFEKFGGIQLDHLKPAYNFVEKERYAVCESITAAVIYECKKLKGFAGRMEWIGIFYPTQHKKRDGGYKTVYTTGHSIVVAHRQAGSDLSDVRTWGNYFVIDLWYYNLGMRDKYLYSSASDRGTYAQKEISKYKKLKVLVDVT